MPRNDQFQQPDKNSTFLNCIRKLSDWLQRTSIVWQTAYYIATYILAAAAVFVLVMSVKSSRQTKEVIDKFTATLDVLTAPLLQFDGYDWLREADKDISCDTPPMGIVFTIRNKANMVPLIVRTIKREFFYGERKFDEEVIAPRANAVILMPGDTAMHGTMQKDLFQKYLQQPKSMFSGPFLRIKYEAEFKSLNSDKTYVYITEQNIGFDCRNPEIKRWQTIDEKLEIKDQ